MPHSCSSSDREELGFDFDHEEIDEVDICRVGEVTTKTLLKTPDELKDAPFEESTSDRDSVEGPAISTPDLSENGDEEEGESVLHVSSVQHPALYSCAAEPEVGTESLGVRVRSQFDDRVSHMRHTVTEVERGSVADRLSLREKDEIMMVNEKVLVGKGHSNLKGVFGKIKIVGKLTLKLTIHRCYHDTGERCARRDPEAKDQRQKGECVYIQITATLEVEMVETSIAAEQVESISFRLKVDVVDKTEVDKIVHKKFGPPEAKIIQLFKENHYLYYTSENVCVKDHQTESKNYTFNILYGSGRDVTQMGAPVDLLVITYHHENGDVCLQVDKKHGLTWKTIDLLTTKPEDLPTSAIWLYRRDGTIYRMQSLQHQGYYLAASYKSRRNCAGSLFLEHVKSENELRLHDELKFFLNPKVQVSDIPVEFCRPPRRRRLLPRLNLGRLFSRLLRIR